MSRFYAPKKNVKGNLIYIDGTEARHILNVMRLGVNDKVVVFDGTGKEYTGFIKSISRKSLVVEVVSTRIPKPESRAEITLAQAIPKKDKMDYIAEKATELGVHRIIPIRSERTIVRPCQGKANNKLIRWRRIAREAAKQCGRSDVPEIENAQNFYNAVDIINDFDLALMGCLSDDTMPIRDAIKDFETGKIIVFIGPEGDFTSEEIEMAKDTNCRLITLGRKVLKSDTAGLYVLSVLDYEFSG